MGALFVLLVLLIAPDRAGADTLYLKTGEVRSMVVERFSDGAFWVRDGKRTIILRPEEITKIIFSESVERVALIHPSAKAKTPASPSASAAALLTVPSASAEPADSTFESQLVILNYRANAYRGIFQIVGEVENRMEAEARYVKISVTLMAADGGTLIRIFPTCSRRRLISNPKKRNPFA